MASKARIARFVQRRGGPGLQLNRGIIYRPACATVASGLLVEGTPYKDTVYIHHYVQPFFLPQERIVLTYSRRLPSSTGSDYFEGTDGEIAERCLQAADVRRLLDEPVDERAFVGLVARGQVRGHDWRTDLALSGAHAVLGEAREATACLARAGQSFEQFLAVRAPLAAAGALRSTLDAMATILAASPGRVADLLREQGRANAASLGFDLSPPAPPGEEPAAEPL